MQPLNGLGRHVIDRSRVFAPRFLVKGTVLPGKTRLFRQSGGHNNTSKTCAPRHTSLQLQTQTILAALWLSHVWHVTQLYISLCASPWKVLASDLPGGYHSPRQSRTYRIVNCIPRGVGGTSPQDGVPAVAAGGGIHRRSVRNRPGGTTAAHR